MPCFDPHFFAYSIIKFSPYHLASVTIRIVLKKLNKNWTKNNARACVWSNVVVFWHRHRLRLSWWIRTNEDSYVFLSYLNVFFAWTNVFNISSIVLNWHGRVCFTPTEFLNWWVCVLASWYQPELVDLMSWEMGI